MTAKEVLKQCTVDGLVVKLPDIKLERKLYQEVAKSLELIGGKWKGGKIMGFVFSTEPSDLLEDIITDKKRNIQKEFQFFPTPSDLADELVNYASINEYSDVLEPSAGQGAIVKAIQRSVPNKVVDCYELMETNRLILSKIDNVNLIGEDFLNHNDKKYDFIIANPPFSKNQDIDHVMKMYDHLKIGGKIVTITSKHWKLSNNKKETKFRDFLDDVNAEVYEIENGAFKESGTMVGGFILVINKN